MTQVELDFQPAAFKVKAFIPLVRGVEPDGRTRFRIRFSRCFSTQFEFQQQIKQESYMKR